MTKPLEAIQEIYDSLPALNCQGKCANSCGPIDMSTAERERIAELGYVIPRFTEERAQRWANDEPLHCPALNRQTLKCDVYEARPLICRLWGMSESMLCPNGCKPIRTLSDSETYDLLLRTFQIGGHHHHQVDEESQRTFQALLGDPEIGPLIARFIRGDRTVERELVEAIERKRS